MARAGKDVRQGDEGDDSESEDELFGNPSGPEVKTKAEDHQDQKGTGNRMENSKSPTGKDAHKNEVKSEMRPSSSLEDRSALTGRHEGAKAPDQNQRSPGDNATDQNRRDGALLQGAGR